MLGHFGDFWFGAKPFWFFLRALNILVSIAGMTALGPGGNSQSKSDRPRFLIKTGEGTPKLVVTVFFPQCPGTVGPLFTAWLHFSPIITRPPTPKPLASPTFQADIGAVSLIP